MAISTVRPYLLLTGLLCSVDAPAQRYAITPSDTYANAEGQGVALRFGMYPSMRYQLVDGYYRGTAMTIREIAFRPNAIYSASSGLVGRRWTGVSIDLSACDFATVTGSFAANAKSTPTRVFSAATSWRFRSSTFRSERRSSWRTRRWDRPRICVSI